MISYQSYGSQTWRIKKMHFSKQRPCGYGCMDILHGPWLNGWRRSLTATSQECWIEQILETTSHKTAALRSITKAIRIRRIRQVGYYWRSRDELISDVLLWTPLHAQPKTGWPARTNVQQLCADTGGSLEVLPEAMDNSC